MRPAGSAHRVGARSATPQALRTGEAMNAHVGPKTMIHEAVPSRAGAGTAVRLLQFGAIIGEILLVAQVLGGADWTAAIFAHLGIVAMLVLAVVALEGFRVETGPLQTFILLTFAGGPIGAAAALLGQQPIGRPDSGVLEDWYNTIAPTEAPAVTLVDMIIDGRLVRRQSRLPRPYDSLLSTGTMQEKQALLAYLAIEDDEKFVEVAL